jgi:hypothetical protein
MILIGGQFEIPYSIEPRGIPRKQNAGRLVEICTARERLEKFRWIAHASRKDLKPFGKWHWSTLLIEVDSRTPEDPPWPSRYDAQSPSGSGLADAIVVTTRLAQKNARLVNGEGLALRNGLTIFGLLFWILMETLRDIGDEESEEYHIHAISRLPDTLVQ